MSERDIRSETGEPFIARDGAKIFELLRPETSEIRNMSIATGYLEPGQRALDHYHEVSEEVYYIENGEGSVRLRDDIYDIQHGQAVYVAPRVVHGLHNTGETVMKVLAISSPSYSDQDAFFIPETRIYDLIWQTARPLYEQGRPFDIAHIEIGREMLHKIFEEEGDNQSVIEPAWILHDNFYPSQLLEKAKGDFTQPDLKRVHMEEGAKVADRILRQIGYPPDLRERVVYLVLHHDEWAFGNHQLFQENRDLAILGDVDFLFLTTELGFEVVRKQMGLSYHQMLDFMRNHEKLTNRPFVTLTARHIFEQNMQERESKA